ncbi:nucleoside triphosphate pyrophosphohydrolase [Paenibacillus macquariensis]|uniref:Predicted house-cleaning noncanonical NTP pyrophosphatase, all-alpha NTP-PPase (MazG) superfamily n=1 Tax=Paenibacillus macquariensis TaxID=948756 RepID=A0ABY1JK85_9BACL|nr:nucleoside triphosphate pyrophosphohydrolase [Paenibacillus macquariensis]MEC0089879.1 nucleoside triphosphate pyrophosphohydrolase [Paenibacillus macquariensis]OAB30659.1 phosphoribosyl-ATP pyrophosphohydrolase [Paenibacillus macquariensis subsp. macquariensis]SIQ33361.1 Predicted house-cleaning noncanonical NTP pyrophosphatase, all-alpha NTP-PPase (MazG) superfamily [Paenibacillus macquariensis]
MKTYNKLVRDKIPQIIEASGKQYTVRVMDETEYAIALKTKMQEELNEFLEASEEHQMGELADLLEVVYSFAFSKGVRVEELEGIRQGKCDERGGFLNRILLVSSE